MAKEKKDNREGGKGKRKRVVKKTRQYTQEKWAGTPTDLPVSTFPSYSDIARYYYLICEDVNIKQADYVDNITKAVIDRWQTACPTLPLRTWKSIRNKVTDLKKNVNLRNGNRKKKRQTGLEANKDLLFDIAACTCDLPILPCNDRLINCKDAKSDAGCNKKHIHCSCKKEAKVYFLGIKG